MGMSAVSCKYLWTSYPCSTLAGANSGIVIPGGKASPTHPWPKTCWKVGSGSHPGIMVNAASSTHPWPHITGKVAWHDCAFGTPGLGHGPPTNPWPNICSVTTGAGPNSGMVNSGARPSPTHPWFGLLGFGYDGLHSNCCGTHAASPIHP